MDGASTQTLSQWPRQQVGLSLVYVWMVSVPLWLTAQPVGGKDLLLLGVPLLLGNAACRILWFWLLMSQPQAQRVQNQEEGIEKVEYGSQALKRTRREIQDPLRRADSRAVESAELQCLGVSPGSSTFYVNWSSSLCLSFLISKMGCCEHAEVKHSEMLDGC